MAGLIFFNAQKLLVVNDKQVQNNNDIIVLVNTLELLVKQHKDDKAFSFYVAPNYPGNYIYADMRRTDDPKTREYSFVEVLYPRYFTTKNPQYKLLLR